MFFTEDKLERRIQELEPYRYVNPIKLSKFKFQLDVDGGIGEYPPQDGEWSSILVGDYWSGWDTYVWLASEVELPSEWAGHQVVGLFDFGKIGQETNLGFEALLFLNGKPYQGVDSNHVEVLFPNDMSGAAHSLHFRLWSGLHGKGKRVEQEHKIQQAEIACLEELTDDLYFTGKAVIETIHVLDKNSAQRMELLKALDQAFLQIDWTYPGSDRFYQSVAEACDVLHSRLEHMHNNHPITVNCIGHTHIDVAWLWRLKHTREKAARSFSTVLRLMEKYQEYTFLQTQPQLYDYIKKDYPEIYEQIKERIKEGRWEAGGAMWLEADCNIPSGESLVRQILQGTSFFRDEFGVECRNLWLPDVFGYSWALPQILKKSGIDSFMTTKISWSQYNQMPHDTFYWRGIDGTEILTHFITTPVVNDHVKRYCYNGHITPYTVSGIWERYQDKNINQDLLLAYGYGDGGGGVNREMLEMRRRLEDMPGLPKVVTSRSDDYFEELKETVNKTDQYVHTWDGELYLELHRGTYTSQAFIKQVNRELELLSRQVEWLGVLTSVQQLNWSSYKKERLKRAWEIILRNQFHDIIPGTSIPEVNEDCASEYKVAKELLHTVWHENAGVLVQSTANQETDGDQHGEVVTIFNSDSWSRSDVISIPKFVNDSSGSWYDVNGEELECVLGEEAWLVHVKEMPSMGYTSLTFKGEGVPTGSSDAFETMSEAKAIMTPFYKVEWNDLGQITRMYDREAGREVLAEEACGNVFQVFENKPLRGDAWGIDLFYQEKMKEVVELQSFEIKEMNALQLILHLKWNYGNSMIEQDVILYAENRRIDFRTTVDWYQREELLKVAFPVDVRATEATYDIQFGNVKRPTHWNTSWDYARFETVGHFWADLSESGYGVGLLNNSKYGYDIKDNVIRLTLLNSPIVPDPHADQGRHAFTYSLLPHTGDWREGSVVQEAWKLNNPVRVEAGMPVKAQLSLFHCSLDHVMIDAVKQAEDDEETVVIRLHEYAGSRGHVEICSDLPIHSWRECNLMEQPIEDRNDQSPFTFSIKPYEIKTFLLRMGGI
ncbi:alpha-mannosidase [Radiobacillus sp. PE A8.2]|uniref:alpha-mannosidase n=1 Tax=Radiobacillus sp. PE A8.2 TaxID=3380349 RepID=UPI00388DD5B0